MGVAEPSRLLLLSVKTRTTHVALQFGFLLQRFVAGTGPPRLGGSLSQLEGVRSSGTCEGMRHSDTARHRHGKLQRDPGFIASYYFAYGNFEGASTVEIAKSKRVRDQVR